ncbi:MAG: hypothetical protein M0R32_09220 [Candidatus Cloacimonetes bacterium]|jgi:hypothetical protein|nr:hypothetical protein [Candidatus Cloacimonadota bacterium]
MKDKRVQGATAIIRNVTAGGKLIAEGEAVLKRKIAPNRWVVRFPNDYEDVERFVQEEDVL